MPVRLAACLTVILERFMGLFMANRRYTSQFLYQFEAMPVMLSCNFVVASSDAGGLGITNLRGSGIKSVYMHTSATAAAGNPNPAAGYIQVQLTDNYNKLLNGVRAMIHSPYSGSSTTTTAHTTYVITALGTATLAQWQAVGLPVGVTPAVGVAFTATASGTIGGSATVGTTSNSGINCIEIVGHPSTSLALSQSAANGGGIITLQCLGATNSSTTTLIPTAPADGSTISLMFYLSNSSVTLAGQ